MQAALGRTVVRWDAEHHFSSSASRKLLSEQGPGSFP
jgi:hypothetical protein